MSSSQKTKKRSAGFRLTERDIEIIRYVHSYRRLRSKDHILPLFGGSEHLLRRLQHLSRHKYLFRFSRKRAHHQDIYALGNKGARLLHDLDEIPLPKKLDLPGQNRRLLEKHIEHTLGIADVMIAIELACRSHPSLRFISQKEIIDAAPQQTRIEAHKLKGKPLLLETDVQYNREWVRGVRTEPDRLFGLHFTDRAEGKNKRRFALELDRGTMTVIPAPRDERKKPLSKPSIIKKMSVYLHSWEGDRYTETNLYEEHFGFRNLRTLFVVSGRYYSGKERVKNFIKANQIVTEGLGSVLFLFTDKDSFLASDNILTASLTNGRGETVTLIS